MRHVSFASKRQLEIKQGDSLTDLIPSPYSDKCCFRVQQAVAKLPKDYCPVTIQPLPTYELFQDGTWQGAIRAQGKIPQSVWGAEDAMRGFHSLSNTSGRCCAISGLGRYAPENSTLIWSDPGLTISHIIPPQHFELFPVDKSGMDGEEDELAEKWRMTWDPQENGIVLLGHLHALWKARLIAVEPMFLTIRCFGPYDSIAAYEGKKASFSKVPNKEALRWHYNMCVYENITAKQDVKTTTAIPPTPSRSDLSISSTKAVQVPFSASEVLPFALPPLGNEQKTPQATRPLKRPRANHGVAVPQLAHTTGSSSDLAKQLCTLRCILYMGKSDGWDPSCPNFSKHRRPVYGTMIYKLDMTVLSSWGLVRDEDVPKSQLDRESIISEYEIVSRESAPILKVVLPYGYTVIGKGVVRPGHSDSTAAAGTKEPAFTPLTEADILERLGSQLAGECVPFCLGLLKLKKKLRDDSYDSPIERVLLLSSADIPLSKAGVSRHNIEKEIMRTVEDMRSRGVTLRERLLDSDMRWNPDAQRVMVVNFAGARIGSNNDTAVLC